MCVLYVVSVVYVLCVVYVLYVRLYTPWHACAVRERLVGVGSLLSSWSQGLDL